ncbi:SAF domain-containing protein [Dietzia sp.]|uniref:SAF domain-containing protein n=1 Tax=Dietzia sp. TaxID=1871616 RepID=UPI002FD9FCB9
MFRSPPTEFRRSSGARTPLDSLRLRRRWRQLAALALVLAAALAHFAGPSVSRTVLVARSDLDAGHVLADSDLSEREAPPELVPESALTPEAAAGAALSAPIGRGEILTSGAIAGPRDEPPRGQNRIVSVPVADPGTLPLLREGGTVDVYAGDAGSGDFTRDLARESPRGESGEGPGAPASPSLPREPLIAGAIVTKVPHDSRGNTSGTVALSVPAAQAPVLAQAGLEVPLALIIAE